MAKESKKTKRQKTASSALTPIVSRSPETIRNLASKLIYTVRNQRVILDADVAEFYGRTTSAVNQQRSRNADRFPDSFAFQLTDEEWKILKSQNVISRSHGGRRSAPWAYTEHGFAMLATRLRGPEAAFLSQIIIETFVSYRRGTLPAARVFAGADADKERKSLQSTLYTKMENLLKMELPSETTLGKELSNITTKSLGRVKAVLDNPKVKNEHISAEIIKLEAETAKLYAEARKTDAESASIWADTLQKRVQMIVQLREMASQLERDEVLDLIDGSFGEVIEASPLNAPKELK